jgi:hypothetical protein
MRAVTQIFAHYRVGFVACRSTRVTITTHHSKAKSTAMTSREYLRITLTSCLGFLAWSNAGAVTFEIQRLSDTSAIIKGTGSFEPLGFETGNDQIFSLDAPFSLAPGPVGVNWIAVSTDLLVGGVPWTEIYEAGADENYSGLNHPVIYVSRNGLPQVLLGEISGTFEINLVDGTLAPVGSSGRVFRGAACTGCGFVVEVGSWRMTASSAVPLPSAFPLFALSMIGLIGVTPKLRRRCHPLNQLSL